MRDKSRLCAISSNIKQYDTFNAGPAAKDPVRSQALGFVASKFHPFPCLLPQQFPARKLPRMSTNTIIITWMTEHIPPRQKPQTDRQHGSRPLFLNARSPVAVAAGRDARGEKPRLGEARRNARVGGPHGVQAHDASHQAHTDRHQSLQADPTAASQLATLLAGPSQLIPS